MRVVVGSGPSQDLKCAELDRHLEFMAEFATRAGRGEDGRNLTLILRSASSSAARALIGMTRELSAAGIAAKAVVTALDPEDDLRALASSLVALSPQEPAKALIRWARNPRLLDAHEQVTYGQGMCWSGDAMRREADRRNGLSLVRNAPDAVRLANLAFAQLWRASSTVSERRLAGNERSRPSGAYQLDPARLATLSQSRLQGWPLVRH